MDVPDAIAHHDHPDYHGDLMDVITVDHLIKLRADLIDAVDHHRAVRDGHADLSHPDVIAAYDARERALDAWQYAYHHAAPSVWIEYIARTDPANGARRDAG